MPVRLRPLRAADRDPLESLLRGTAAFDEGEIAVAMELIDLGIGPPGHGYRFLVAEEDGVVLGYACFGETPCTQGTWDLYWIAVDAKRQGTGVGRALLRASEEVVREERGRLLLIETASKPAYASQRTFYERSGYLELARIPDFYRPGDAKIVYGKCTEAGVSGTGSPPPSAPAPRPPGPRPDQEGPATLRLPRLLLRGPTLQDAEALFPYVHGEAGRVVTDTLCWDGPDTLEDMRDWVRRYGSGPFEPRGFQWVVVDREGAVSGREGTALGTICLRPHGPTGRVDLGYYVGRPWWGRGVMREAISAVVRHAFDLGAAKVEAEVFLTNPRGLRLLEGLGFRREATVRRAVFKRGAWLDEAVYGLLPGEGLLYRDGGGRP